MITSFGLCGIKLPSIVLEKIYPLKPDFLTFGSLYFIPNIDEGFRVMGLNVSPIALCHMDKTDLNLQLKLILVFFFFINYVPMQHRMLENESLSKFHILKILLFLKPFFRV